MFIPYSNLLLSWCRNFLIFLPLFRRFGVVVSIFCFSHIFFFGIPHDTLSNGIWQRSAGVKKIFLCGVFTFLNVKSPNFQLHPPPTSKKRDSKLSESNHQKNFRYVSIAIPCATLSLSISLRFHHHHHHHDHFVSAILRWPHNVNDRHAQTVKHGIRNVSFVDEI